MSLPLSSYYSVSHVINGHSQEATILHEGTEIRVRKDRDDLLVKIGNKPETSIRISKNLSNIMAITEIEDLLKQN